MATLINIDGVAINQTFKLNMQIDSVKRLMANINPETSKMEVHWRREGEDVLVDFNSPIAGKHKKWVKFSRQPSGLMAS